MDSVERAANVELEADPGLFDPARRLARRRSSLTAAAGAGVGLVLLLLVTVIRVFDYPRPGTPIVNREEMPAALAPLAQQRKELQQEVAQLQKQIEDSAQDVATLRAQAERARAELVDLEAQRKAEVDALEQRRQADARTIGLLVTSPAANGPVGSANGAAPGDEGHNQAHAPRPRSAKDFLRVARQQIRDGSSDKAAVTLEMAEVRALNEAEDHAGPIGAAMQIRNARMAVQAGHPEDALHILDSAAAR
jgi:hypothetical protein